MINNNDLEELSSICRSTVKIEIGKKPEISITRDFLIHVVKKEALHHGYNKMERNIVESLVKNLEEIFNTEIGIELTLTDDNHTRWLQDRLLKINWQYWNRYKRFLAETGMAEATIERHEENTLKILGYLEPPEKTGRWETRGMVVGYVQSGKTGNYAGLICRSIDIGYKVIVVLAGTHNSLRSQTQERLDESVLGYDSIRKINDNDTIKIGVGCISKCSVPVDSITTSADDGDFSRQVANHFNISPGGHPLLFVIKKNGSILKNLLEWIEFVSHGQRTTEGTPIVRDVPMLVIDDEADFGSIDTRPQTRLADGQIDEDHDPTIINERIRKLLYYFEKSAYVGYTATPYASVFIHPGNRLPGLGKDLFPENFIICLPIPSNYIGPLQVFGIKEDLNLGIEAVKGLPMVVEVSDAKEWMPPKHDKFHQPMYGNESRVPPSLRRAILNFILSAAIRHHREQLNKHNSMLIHVTRLTAVQERVCHQVQEYLDYIKQRIRYGDGDMKPTIFDELEEIFNKDFALHAKEISGDDYIQINWIDLLPHIKIASEAIVPVRQINGTAGDILDYRLNKENGLSVIAVGGEKLSRGLTLEGLTVSYFLRNSRMYDTLMQMGRWFGYRSGYLDTCRIYLSDELRRAFIDITFANEELYGDFDQMVNEGKKPIDFGLKVRYNPGLLVTAPAKMRAGTRLSLSFAGDISETVVFYKSGEVITANQEAVFGLVRRISKIKLPELNPTLRINESKILRWHGLRWNNVSAEEICTFLTKYQTHINNRRVNAALMANYIRKMVNAHSDCLNCWTVFIPAGSEKTRKSYNLPDPVNGIHRMIDRAVLSDDDLIIPVPEEDYRIRRLINPSDEAVDLTATQWLCALKKTETFWNENPRKNRNKEIPDIPSGMMIRKVRNESMGLLMIYPLEPDNEKSDLGENGPPIFGFGISFPFSSKDKKVDYIVTPMFDDQDYGDDE